MSEIKIKRALISVFYKDGLEPIVHALAKQGVEFVSTGGTQKFIEELGYNVVPVEKLTGYPSIFGGRVKTLHPVIFGGILFRRDNEEDVQQANQYGIPSIDLIIVDLYPFEETVASGGSEEQIIEKIDIGGISLIRAAAKNFKDTLIVSSREHYAEMLALLDSKNGTTNLSDRKNFATKAFDITSHYDSAIFGYFNQANENGPFKESAARFTSSELPFGASPTTEPFAGLMTFIVSFVDASQSSPLISIRYSEFISNLPFKVQGSEFKGWSSRV